MRLAAAAVAALLPLLGGCVIYSNEGGEKVSVVTDQNAARTEALEAVRKVDFDGQRLNVVVGSNGCTEASSFEVRIKDADPAELTLVRRSPDMCKALVPEGKTVSWGYDELGLERGQPVRVLNPISL
ncbi:MULTISPECIES: hypothetical protein [Brevundimonas]|jgi:hypothetical protein|uniref:hypothetical protein n=1 Tax=Brevundimonas TaxID=41275 RepID=UPI00190847FD|nr:MULTISPECIES: hypothetical protein [Brevundimonas]MDA0743174.1 hypothetical protein [Pseudomonadota bacterium]MBK1970108.1 hypothetical protein [Brevundimonas diminuta]MBK1977060.1 hypothetical protein [Brevundimonas diminuta]MDA1320766.1 hypothetical protein [Pseudomonadota bacterium]MDM8354045.1 hypothetical protein [Brevundimonas diminuta]